MSESSIRCQFLVIVALAWARHRGIGMSVLGGPWFRDAATGVVAAAALAAVNYWLLCRAPPLRSVRSIRRFGVLYLYMGGRDSLAFGCWVAVMGAALGWLANATGGLLAPMLAHALYDAAALLYISRGQDCAAIAEPGGQSGS